MKIAFFVKGKIYNNYEYRLLNVFMTYQHIFDYSPTGSNVM